MFKLISPRRITLLIAAIILLFAVGAVFKLYPDILWFNSLGYTSVYAKILLTRLSLMLSVGLAVFLFIFVNLDIAFGRKHRNPELVKPSADPRFDNFTNILENEIRGANPQAADLLQEVKDFINKLTKNVAILVIALLSLLIGLSAGGSWEIFLRFINHLPFGIVDPIFNQDVGFYIFQLPFITYALQTTFTVLFLTFVTVIWFYIQRGNIWPISPYRVSAKASAHLSLLGAMTFGAIAYSMHLASYRLLFASSGVVHGPGFTEVNAMMLNYRLLFFLAIFGVAASLYNIIARQPKIIGAVALTMVATAILVGGFYPAIMQRWFVDPNEFVRQKQYMENNIKFTRLAYGLDKVQEKEFPAVNSLNSAAIARNQATVENIRLWDSSPLRKTFSQLQEIRLYYEFPDVDIDRYQIDGKMQQVMLAVRELDASQLTAQAQTWMNKHIVYTHGYGVVMSPVNAISEEGLPRFYIKNLPPESSINLQIRQPEIYFGEKSSEYVLVNTKEQEFDYPQGDSNKYATYRGQGGVPIPTLWHRILYAVRFGDLRILLSGTLTSESKIMYDRSLFARVNAIAPFFRYDRDPYIVIGEDGRLFWILDAYTVSDHFPYSEPTGQFNYIRNPIKIVIDAYNGFVDFYLTDPQDPIAQVYNQIFPGLLKPYSAMPSDLRSHVRYPMDLFAVQGNMYATYHMQDPKVFYNREDLWSVPRRNTQETQDQMQPYYLNMRLPGDNRDSFLGLLPFSPSNKQNMIAWLCVQCDPENYGKMLVYKFPKQKQIFGPGQIEARIDQDTEISQKLTLWGQKGSSVIRGELLVIPIEDSLLYIQPVYLQSTSGQLPELKRIIVAYENQIVMKPTLPEALAAIFSGYSVSWMTPSSEDEQTEQPNASNPILQDINLKIEIKEIFNKALQYQREGNWAGYGAAIDRLRGLIEKLQ